MAVVAYDCFRKGQIFWPSESEAIPLLPWILRVYFANSALCIEFPVLRSIIG